VSIYMGKTTGHELADGSDDANSPGF
jgi:hypothetical protein